MGKKGVMMETVASSSPTTLSLTMPARAENIVYCRLALAGLARSHEIDPELLADMKLAVTEACSNSVRHAYRDGVGAVSVRIEFDDERIAIEVADDGQGFIPPSEPVGVAELREGGMGLALIRALSDELVVSAGRNGRGSLVSFNRRVC
jgi:serine/threonine-protein kinase RsbW